MKTITAEERRRRLAIRHGLGTSVANATEAARAVVCLHGTDPSTIYLSAWARVGHESISDIDAALYETRSVVKHMAMRRTLHVLPLDNLAMAQAAASQRVGAAETRRLIKDVEASGLTKNGKRWLAKAQQGVLEALADREASFTELKSELPVLAKKIVVAPESKWGGEMPVGPRVLTTLSADGLIVRASNDGAWYASRNKWTLTETWLGEPIAALTEAEGTAALTRAWLRSFGPGTTEDIKWWMGSTLTNVRRALVDIDAVEVDLDGKPGWVLPDDVDDTPEPEPWIALLPSLDPTAMGWNQREWYLGDYKSQIFDTVGNAGPTIWHNGRIVGGWAQRESGEVVTELLEDVGAEAESAIAQRAEELTVWCSGKRVMPRFPSPLSKQIAALTEGPPR